MKCLDKKYSFHTRLLKPVTDIAVASFDREGQGDSSKAGGRWEKKESEKIHERYGETEGYFRSHITLKVNICACAHAEIMIHMGR